MQYMPHGVKPTYFDHIKRKWKNILLFGVITMFFISGISLFMPLEYRADTQIFILPKNVTDLDTYTNVKSTERLGDNLSRLILTSSFEDLVLLAGRASIDQSYFPQDAKKRSKAWGRMVRVTLVPGTGLIKISVYHKSKDQARIILQGIADVLATRGPSYTGFDVEMRQVDVIVLTDYPVRPNVFLNALLGLILGAIISSVYVVVENEKAWVL